MKCTTLWQAGLNAALSVAAARCAHAQGAAAPPLSVALEYQVSSTCPDAQEFRAIVIKRLGRDPFVESSPNQVLVVVSPGDDTLSGELIWRDRAGNTTGSQTFPSRTKHCAQVVAAMGFALAVQIQLLEVTADDQPIQASRVAPTPDSTQSKASIALERPSLEHEPPAVVAQEPKSRGESPIFFVGGGAAADLGMSSQLVPAGRVFAGLRWALSAVELALEASAPVTTRRADGAGFSQWHLLASAAGCGVVEPLTVCAVLKAGTVRAYGRDVDAPSGASAALVQSGLRLALSQHLSTITSLSLRAEGLVNVTRWSVALDDFPVWSAPRLALNSGLDFAVRFR